jgi:hypothetical protein
VEAQAVRRVIEVIEDVNDVDVDGIPADNEVLAYDSTTGKWTNQTAAEAGLAASSHTHDDRYYTEAETDAVAVAAAGAAVTSHEASYDHDNYDTAYGWGDHGAAGYTTAHALLSASHTDTVAAGVSRGSIIIGSATPKWEELVIGASGTYLCSDGTDISWSTIQAGDLPAHTHDGDILEHDGQTITGDTYLIDTDKWVWTPGGSDEAINAAIDALNAGGGMVQVMAGTHTVNSSVEIDVDYTVLDGGGRGCYLDAQTIAADIPIECVNHDHVALRNFRVEGPGGGTHPNVLASQSLYCEWSGIYSTNAGRDGFSRQTISSYGSLFNCIAESNGRYGFSILSSTLMACSFNQAISNNHYGFYFAQAGHMSMVNNICAYNTYGFYLDVDGGSFVSNISYFSGSDGYGWFHKGDNTTMTGNVVRWGEYGAVIDGNYNTICANTFERQEVAGIQINPGESENMFLGNTFDTMVNGGVDINLVGQNDRIGIVANMFYATAGNTETALNVVDGDDGVAVANISVGHDTSSFTLDATSAGWVIGWNKLEAKPTLTGAANINNIMLYPDTANMINEGNYAQSWIAADGARDNQYVGIFHNLESDAGRSYGLYIQAGTDADDAALTIYDYDGSNLLLNVTGAGTVSGTAILDEDDMASDSATHLATQQSIKAYADAVAGGAHTHDGDTLQLDGINSDGGAFSFTTSGAVTFSQSVVTSGGFGAEGTGNASVYYYVSGTRAYGGWFQSTKNDGNAWGAVLQASTDNTGDNVALQAYATNAGAGEAIGAYIRGIDCAVKIGDGQYIGSESVYNAIQIEADGDVVFSQDITVQSGIVYAGVNDTTHGWYYAYGSGAGSPQGGGLFAFTAADYDTNIAYYGFYVQQDDLFIGPNTDQDFIKIIGAAAAADVALQIAGNVGIGVAAHATSKLYVCSSLTTDYTYAAEFFHDEDDGKAYGIKVRCGNDSVAGGNYCYAVDLYRGDDTKEGGLRINAGTVEIWNSSSRRIKDRVRMTTMDSRSIVSGIKVRDYTRKDFPGSWHTGFVAEEMAEVYEPAVARHLNPKDPLGVVPGNLIPVLVKRCQELQEELDRVNRLLAERN